MKFFLFVLLGMTAMNLSEAQNVGIGTSEPLNRLQVDGNLLVGTPTIKTSTAPTAAQTIIMTNPGTVSFPAADSTDRLYDPGGPGFNYLPNSFSEAYISGGSTGIEVIAETIGLGPGDSLIIERGNPPNIVLLAIGNGYTTTGRWVFNSSSLHIIFKSNGDANTGIGFSLLFRKLYDNSASFPDIIGITNKGLFFNTKTGSFKSGFIDDSPITGIGTTSMGAYTNASGNYSTAMGWKTNADGQNSVAMGEQTSAIGPSSTAMGYSTYASGNISTAMGSDTYASGPGSTAIGALTNANGNTSTAMGYGTTAGGNVSTAMGENTDASGYVSTAMGRNTVSKGYAGVAIGMYNNPILLAAQTSSTSSTPLFIVGNGDNSSTLSNALVVLKNGNVGIGSDVPNGNLVINDASNPIIQFQSAGTDIGFVQTSGNNLRLGTNSSNPTGNVIFRLNGGDRLTIFPSGNATLNGTLTQTSDARFKQNIQPLHHALDKLLLLTGYQYYWKPGLKKEDRLQIGLIAQNVETVFPELVATAEDGYKSVAYQNMVAVLIEAIKEQQKEIDELKKIILSKK